MTSLGLLVLVAAVVSLAQAHHDRKEALKDASFSPTLNAPVSKPYECVERQEFSIRWIESNGTTFKYEPSSVTVRLNTVGECRKACEFGSQHYMHHWARHRRFTCVLYRYDPRSHTCTMYLPEGRHTTQNVTTGKWRCSLALNMYYLPMEDVIEQGVNPTTNQKSQLLLGYRMNGQLKGDVHLVDGKVGKGLKLTDHPINVFLGNRLKECFGNLTYCRRGLTYAMWILERQQKDRPSYGRIFHTHDVSVYLVRGRIFAVFQQPRRIWKASAPFRARYNPRHQHDWRYVTIVWGPERGLNLYIDGSLVKASDGEFWEQGAAGRMGHDTSLGADHPRRNGSVVVDELRFWNASLDKSTVHALFTWEQKARKPYHVGKAMHTALTQFPPAPGMKYFLPMDRTSGNILIGDGLNGTCKGDCSLTTGVHGRALVLNRQHQLHLGNKMGECMGNINLCKNGFSISLWFSPQNRGKNEDMIFTSGSEQPGFTLSLENKRLRTRVQDVAGKKIWDSLIDMRSQKQWHFIVVTWREKLRVYVDGRRYEFGYRKTRKMHTIEARNDAMMGYSTRKYHDARPFAVVDAVRFWERELTHREAMATFRAENAIYEKHIGRHRRPRHRHRGRQIRRERERRERVKKERERRERQIRREREKKERERREREKRARLLRERKARAKKQVKKATPAKKDRRVDKKKDVKPGRKHHEKKRKLT